MKLRKNDGDCTVMWYNLKRRVNQQRGTNPTKLMAYVCAVYVQGESE